MSPLQPQKLLLVTRHVDKDIFYQAELVELKGLYVWAVSVGSAAQNVTFTGESYSPLHALSQMRNTLLITNDVANDLLIDVKQAIDTLMDQDSGIDSTLN
jgi:hypothetical protein